MQRSKIIITAIGVFCSIHYTLAWQASTFPDTLMNTQTNMSTEINSTGIDGSPYITPDNKYLIFTTSPMKAGIKQQAMKSFADFETTIHSSNNGSLNFYIVSLDLDKYRSRK